MKDERLPNDAANDRKQYSAPTLTEYGSVAKLTMVKGGSFVELGTNKKTTSCL